MLNHLVWAVTIGSGLFLGNMMIFAVNLAYARYRDRKEKPIAEAYQKQLSSLIDEIRLARSAEFGGLGDGVKLKTHLKVH